MPKYIISVPEVHYQEVRVEANSPKEAVQKLLQDDDVEYLDGALHFSHQLDVECLDVYNTVTTVKVRVPTKD